MGECFHAFNPWDFCLHSVHSEDQPYQLKGDDASSELSSSMSRSCSSVFTDSASDSEDELERHLPLLRPEELASLGVEALQLGHHKTAVKYFLLAQLRWSEVLRRCLAIGRSIEVLIFSLKKTQAPAGLSPIPNVSLTFERA